LIILGIDPGSRFCGYGLLEIENNKIVAAGCNVISVENYSILPLSLKTGNKLSAGELSKDLPGRLSRLYHGIQEIIEKYKPDIAAVETIFYGKNVKSSFILGHARGVILLALSEAKIQIFEYSPREVKKAVAGNGNASKVQIRYMVQQILNLKNMTTSEDASDALAVALCQFNRQKLCSKL